jgi:hypothetical protein
MDARFIMGMSKRRFGGGAMMEEREIDSSEMWRKCRSVLIQSSSVKWGSGRAGSSRIGGEVPATSCAH